MVRLNKLPQIEKQWICSMDDITWPVDRQLKTRPSVRDLALAYGVPVWNAHRALTGVYIWQGSSKDVVNLKKC